MDIEFRTTVPVRHEVDVCVAGGGPSGIAAALAAARQGASVHLIEGEICFGGTGGASSLPMFCAFTDGVNFLADGIGHEVYDRIFRYGGTSGTCRYGDADVYFQPEVLKRVYDDLVLDARISFSFATRLTAVQGSGGVLTHAICQGKSGFSAVRAKAFVDATGDGDLCAMAGAKYQKGDHRGRMQPGTLVSMWSGIDWEAAVAAGHGLWHQGAHLKQAIADGLFTCPDPGMPGIVPTGGSTGNGNIGHLFGVDGTDERSLTRAAIEGRKMLTEYREYFRRYLTGYEKMELSGTPARVGIRETRRITGDYELNAEDFRKRAVFADEIGRYSYPVDLHPTSLDEQDECHRTFERCRLAKGESYGIPYRVLTPVGLHNVLAAGRCVSADRAVNGSLRVMPGCFITGQAAGVAASLAAASGDSIHDLPVHEIQRRLKALGAWLPNFAGESAAVA